MHRSTGTTTLQVDLTQMVRPATDRNSVDGYVRATDYLEYDLTPLVLVGARRRYLTDRGAPLKQFWIPVLGLSNG